MKKMYGMNFYIQLTPLKSKLKLIKIRKLLIELIECMPTFKENQLI